MTKPCLNNCWAISYQLKFLGLLFTNMVSKPCYSRASRVRVPPHDIFEFVICYMNFLCFEFGLKPQGKLVGLAHKEVC
jgi:hypothetical protein